jgi:rod shape-determining protein MreC
LITMRQHRSHNHAVYVISVAAELAGMHPQTLRIYERRGLVQPARTQGGNRRYSDADIDQLRRIAELAAEGMNLEGIRRVMELEAENARLRAESVTSSYDRNRLEEFDGLTAAAEALQYALVPARVVGLGPSQSFSRTATIDAGSDAGIRPDMTVLNNDGLVGRVLRVTRSTATVLLVVDGESVVGGRVGESMDLGFLHGRGILGAQGRLDLELVDDSVVPDKDDSVVTWGSESGAPYVKGIPVGRVTSVFSSVRETTHHAVIEPYVDFGSLDLIGVVVPSGTRSDRAVIEADGSLQ